MIELLIVPSTAQSSGVVTYVAAQAEALVGLRPHVLAPADSDLAHMLDGRIPVLNAEPSLVGMRNAMRDVPGAVVHTHGPRALAAARAAHVPAHRLHHMFHELPWRTGRRGAGELALTLGTARVTNSPGLATALRRRAISISAVLPPIVRRAALVDRSEAEAHLPEANGRYRVGVIGRLSPIKDPWLAVDVVAALPPRVRMGTDLCFVGDGPERARLATRARDRGVRAVFAGHVADAERLFAAFDAVLVPSRFETFGFALTAAALAGIPVVAARSPGSLWIADGCPSFRPLPARPPALATELARALEQPWPVGDLAAHVWARFGERSPALHLEYFRQANDGPRR